MEFDPELMVNIETNAMNEVLVALVATHPDPAALKKVWEKFAAIGTAAWSQNAIGLNHAGFGKAERQHVFEKWSGVFDAAITKQG